ncbi:MAG TPA: DUF362 domain-containing protein [Candidatus Binatia bacterium]|nr:DUF362 domain-containing protein [Candidatus Binatia bacterium]
MMEREFTRDQRVAAVRVSQNMPEWDCGELSKGLQRLGDLLGWSEVGRGPFGSAIPRSARVVVKPNWVMHKNRGPWGLGPLVTDPTLIRAVVEGALAARPSRLAVGDAPLQGCDLARLLSDTALDRWAADLKTREPTFEGLRDFRRTTCAFRYGVRVAREEQQPEADFVLFDLGGESLLEPVTDGCGSFRVTQYDPRQMRKTHAPGRHCYLVARAIIDADVVINVPKLKTHCKAGITNALKNLVGINGNKEYLPHHRVGGSRHGGDCYPGGSVLKRAIEIALDQSNLAPAPGTRAFAWNATGDFLGRLAQLMGDEVGVEGAWSGNDTVWRTCLDLNRILHYGRTDGTLAETPQRRVLHVVDAMVAGQGDGPLAAEPLELGVLLGGGNPAAVDWVGAHLLGYDPHRVALAREAFGRFRWPITAFERDEVRLIGDLGGGAARLTGVLASAQSVKHPPGWRDSAAAALEYR